MTCEEVGLRSEERSSQRRDIDGQKQPLVS